MVLNMYSLDNKQVEIIVADVQLAAITLSHLADDLVDHICCEVEHLISEGNSFEQAYEMVKKQTGIEVLQKIQDNTKFLIDKNYRLMKTTMKITGNISLAILGFGTVFKIMHWAGASVLLVFGFFVLCAIFFPIAVHTNYKKSDKQQNLFLHIAIFIGGVFFMSGVLFKIMHWPGSNVLLLVGYFSLLFLYLPTLLFVHIKKEQAKKLKRINILGIVSLIIYGLSSMFKMFHWPGAAILTLLGAFLLIGLFLPMFTWQRFKMEGKITGQYIFTIILSMFLILFTSLLALNYSKDILGGIVNQANNVSVINKYLEKKNAILLSEINSKKDTLEIKSTALAIKNESDQLCEYMNDIQIELIKRADNLNDVNASLILSSPENIRSKDNWDVVYLMMFGINGNGKAQELKQKLLHYKSSLSSTDKENQGFTKLLDNLINISDKKSGPKITTWEDLNFYMCSLIRAVTTIKELQSDVRIAESYTLSKLNINY
jgi:hypothetical protein